MADDFDNVFDPSVKKKKKKPKKIVDLDEAEEPNERAKVDEPSVNEDTNKENELVQETQEKDIDDDMNFDDFSSMKKKKKKKKKKGFEEGQGNVEETKQEAVENNDENGVKEDEMNDDEMNFSLPTKKKKKKRVPPKENEIGQDDEEKEGSHPDYADKEYTYEQLLTRVFATMMDKNPSYVAGEKRKFIMRPPQVFKIGTKKTSFANFGDICKILHRQPKHLLAYLLAELGTSGSIDSNNQLIIKGRFQQKQIESVLRRYIKEYVTCHTCRSPDTILQKKERLYFLQCETCSSSCSVASIKSGFQAITGRRAALKSKQQ